MNVLHDCDAVFDRLTRGPFPSGAGDDLAVEGHLRVCHECRQLAEALRPAVKLLHEAYADDDSFGEPLPVYRGTAGAAQFGTLSVEDSLNTYSVDQADSRPTPLGTSSALSVSTSGWQLVAACLLGVIVGCLAMGGWLSPDDKQIGKPGPTVTEQGLATLASLNLPSTCLPTSMSLAKETTARLRCCTDCHSSGSPLARGVDVSRVQLACIACHEPGR